MGNFYVNHTVRASQEQVVAVLEAERRTAFVGPTLDGFTIVCDRECDSQDEHAIVALGRRLSARLGGPVLAVLNYDDDLLCYWLFDRGHLIEQYNSCPGLFDDEPRAWPRLYREDREDERPADPRPERGAELCRVFGVPDAQHKVQAILSQHDEQFAMFTHQKLVRLLGLPAAAVATGYRYVAEGDAELDADDCVHIGGRPTLIVR
jgi:hypothetical protein